MNADAPLVSVCVPAHNAAGFIEQSLQAVQAQDHARLEILVSVDQSADETARICRTLALDDPRITVLEQSERQGWLRNVNLLLARAGGDYVCIAAHDDLPHPECVSALLAALQAEPGAALAYADLLLVRPRQRSAKRFRPGAWRPLLPRATALLWQLGWWWIPYRGLIRRAALRECGGLAPSAAGEFSADWPWLLRLSLWGPFVRVPRVLVEKQLRPEGLSRSWRYTPGNWRAVDAECRAAIRAARLSPAARAALLVAAGLCPLRHLAGMALTRIFRPLG